MKKTFYIISSFFVFASISVAQVNPSPLWLRYPTLSPDGKTILFCYKGDIYKVASEGGDAMPLTLSDAYDCLPVWSPDGKQFAYSSDRYGNHDIFLSSLNGGETKRLTFHSAVDMPSSFTADGKDVIFTSTRMDDVKSAYFPSGRLSEVYTVSIKGGMEKQWSTVPMEMLKSDKAGKRFLYTDKKGGENIYRKHHTSSITRDIWMYEPLGNKHTKLTDFNGEDRNALWSADEKEIYYLSEKSGSFNLWKMTIGNPASATQLTKFQKNPVRELSIAQNGTLCFWYDGEVYTMAIGSEPKKLNVNITTEERYNEIKNETLTSGATEMDISPDGKEAVFVVHGEVFVASFETGVTKQITNTPEQERNVSFSSDGKRILYASERANAWGIYQTVRANEGEQHFFSSTVLKEEKLVVNAEENFQPKYNYDASEIAYIENRTTIKVYNLKTKQARLIVPGDKNYSYADGDQWFDWSPDGKYLLIQYLEANSWIGQAGLVDVTGSGKVTNLTQSGYGAGGAKWAMKGQAILYFSSRHGMKSHGSWGFQSDIYAFFLTRKSHEWFLMTKDELMILKEKEEKAKKEKDKLPAASDKLKAPAVELPKAVEIDFEYLNERKERLTIHSSELADGVITSDGEQLFYLTKFESGYDLWVNKFHDKETKLFMKLDASSAGDLRIDKENKMLYLLSDGKIISVNIDKKEKKEVKFSAELTINPAKERAHLFEHVWRQVDKKFYTKDLQGTDWPYYKNQYAKFLPYINNGYDFADLLSELLGELNASHTGGSYRKAAKNGDLTATLAAFYDNTYTGNGVKIAEIIAKSPLIQDGSLIKNGDIIEKIDGVNISNDTTLFMLLNRKAGKFILLSLFDDKSGKRWDETVKPITMSEQYPLLYNRWVKNREAEVEKLSGGRLGYVHVEGMNDESFRNVYEKALGKYGNKEALIVDTRFNGGGWLHDDLATFLSGKKYMSFEPRGQKLGDEPQFKWMKPSVVLISEGNYSDAHMFPFVYKELNIGKLVGMPCPGTGTAVWWETLMDPSIVFGIPEVGMKSLKGEYLENLQLEPDVKQVNDADKISNGNDQQIEAAVKELLKQLGSK